MTGACALMPARIRRFLPLVLAILFLPLAAMAAERTGSLVSIQSGTLAPLGADDPIARVFTVGGRLVALGSASTWMFDEEHKVWRPSDWRPGNSVLAAAIDKARTFLLLGRGTGGALTGIEMVSLDANALASAQLPGAPISLISAKAAVLGSMLYVAGSAADGRLQLLAIDPSAVEPQWIDHGGWPGAGGVITSVAGQNSAVFVTLKGAAGHGDRLLRWKAGEGWGEKAALQGTVIEGGARDIGQAHVLYLVRSATDTVAVPRLQSFHTITGSLATLDDPHAAAARAITAWHDGFLWEQPAADGTSIEFAFAVVESTRHLLHWLDWIVIVVYLVAMLGIGLYFYLREKRNSTVRFLRRRPHHSVLGGGHQPVRRQYQLDQLHRDPGQGLRDQLAVPDQQPDRGARPDVRRGLDRAVAAPTEPDVGVPVSGNALPSRHPHAGQRAVHRDADRQPHERHSVPAVAGDRDHHGHRRDMEHPDDGRCSPSSTPRWAA